MIDRNENNLVVDYCNEKGMMIYLGTFVDMNGCGSSGETESAIFWR